MTLLEAIAHVEGFYVADSRPNRNNNPGDLEFHPWMEHHGGTLEVGAYPRFAKFPTSEQGFDALQALLKSSTYRGLTIEQAIGKFAPSSENNTSNYIATVCHFTGLQSMDVIDTHL